MHMRSPIRLILAAALAFLLGAPTAKADDTPEWKTCISVTMTGAERLPACSAVIEGRTQEGRKQIGRAHV